MGAGEIDGKGSRWWWVMLGLKDKLVAGPRGGEVVIPDVGVETVDNIGVWVNESRPLLCLNLGAKPCL